MSQIDQMKDDVTKNVQKGKQEVQRSAKDWYGYIEKHPLQSMLFGTVIYFAIKGFLRD